MNFSLVEMTIILPPTLIRKEAYPLLLFFSLSFFKVWGNLKKSIPVFIARMVYCPDLCETGTRIALNKSTALLIVVPIVVRGANSKQLNKQRFAISHSSRECYIDSIRIP